MDGAGGMGVAERLEIRLVFKAAAAAAAGTAGPDLATRRKNRRHN